MKKKQNFNPLQLSFFDEVVTHKNYGNESLLDENWKSVIDHFQKEKQSTNHSKTENNGRDLSESNGGKQPGVSDADKRGNPTDVATSVEGEGTLRNVEGTTAKAIFTNEKIRRIDSISTEDFKELLRPDEPSHHRQWDDGDRSRRTGMAGIDESGWPELASLESLLDFKILEIVLPNDKGSNYIVSASIGESLGEKGEKRSFIFDGAPSDPEITKAVLDTYKEIAGRLDYANGGFYEQKLHTIAAGVLAKVNQSISEEKVIEEPLTDVTNFHSLAAPYENKSFSKKIKYRDNIAALDLLLKLEAAHRNATPEEQITLARYVGWGGLKEILLDPNNDAHWKTTSDIELRSLVKDVYDRLDKLDEDGSQGLLSAAKRSIINAHYTA